MFLLFKQVIYSLYRARVDLQKYFMRNHDDRGLVFLFSRWVYGVEMIIRQDFP